MTDEKPEPWDPDSEVGRRVADGLGDVLVEVELRLARERAERKSA